MTLTSPSCLAMTRMTGMTFCLRVGKLFPVMTPGLFQKRWNFGPLVLRHFCRFPGILFVTCTWWKWYEYFSISVCILILSTKYIIKSFPAVDPSFYHAPWFSSKGPRWTSSSLRHGQWLTQRRRHPPQHLWSVEENGQKFGGQKLRKHGQWQQFETSSTHPKTTYFNVQKKQKKQGLHKQTKHHQNSVEFPHPPKKNHKHKPSIAASPKIPSKHSYEFPLPAPAFRSTSMLAINWGSCTCRSNRAFSCKTSRSSQRFRDKVQKSLSPRSVSNAKYVVCVFKNTANIFVWGGGFWGVYNC